jgi:hypothetical protein
MDFFWKRFLEESGEYIMKETFDIKWDKNFWKKEAWSEQKNKRFIVLVTGQAHSTKIINSFDTLSQAKIYVETISEYFENFDLGDATYSGPLYEGCDTYIRDLLEGKEWLFTDRWEEM